MAQALPPDPVGQALPSRIGRYDVERVLGERSVGLLVLALDSLSNRWVALKLPNAADPDTWACFEREARLLARLSHPNVITLLDFGHHTDGSPYMVMDLPSGTSLQSAMRERPMPLERILAVVIQVLAGLAHAHAAGIVHRDIKPATIFVTQDGIVKVMDFPVARPIAGSINGIGTLTGTPDYMSPEQVKGLGIDRRSDLFSVGCMLFELLTREPPFHSEDLMAILYKVAQEEPNFDLIPEGEPTSHLVPILKRALQKDTEKRYQSAYEFALDLAPIHGSLAGAASGKSEWILRLAHVAR